MTLVPTARLLADAAADGVGLGAFNVIHLETAEALVAAAERAARPLVLQISQNCVAYHGALEPLAAASRALAEASPAPVALHLDHAEDEDLARRAVALGFGSVMIDASKLDYAHNVAATARTVEHAHAHDVLVEAELGAIGGKQGAHTPGVRTDPDEAVRFVADTGVDALAVAVGSEHAMTTRTAGLDRDLIARLRAAVPVPLVLHGSSGVSDDGLVGAIRAGMTKINVSTHLVSAFTAAVRERLDADPALVDSRRYVGAGRDALGAAAEHLLRVFSTERTEGSGA